MSMKASAIAATAAVLVVLVGVGPGNAASTHKSDLNNTKSPTLTMTTVSSIAITESSSLDSYLAGLSAADRATFVRNQLPATTTMTLTMTPVDSTARAQALAHPNGVVTSPTTTGCWRAKASWEQRNVLGVALYNFWQVDGWCVIGGKIVSSSILDYGGQTFAVGWRYAGRTASGVGIVSGEARSYGQFKFILGVGGWDVDSRLECSRVRAKPTPPAAGDMVCGIY